MNVKISYATGAPTYGSTDITYWTLVKFSTFWVKSGLQLKYSLLRGCRYVISLVPWQQHDNLAHISLSWSWITVRDVCSDATDKDISMGGTAGVNNFILIRLYLSTHFGVSGLVVRSTEHRISTLCQC